LRRGEFVDLTVDAVVQIGSAYSLRVPVGKLHSDRYVPLHPQLKALLDDWLARRSAFPLLRPVLALWTTHSGSFALPPGSVHHAPGSLRHFDLP
jgi:hypothetical protein